MSLIAHHFPSLDFSLIKPSTQSSPKSPNAAKSQKPLHKICTKSPFFYLIYSLALTVTLNPPLPSLAFPSINSQPPPLSPTIPFSQSKNLQLGLENGKIRPCRSANPGCVSSNPKSLSFAFPWRIPETNTKNAIQTLQEAILKTQKNVKISC